jgi:hypothetical protein
MAQVRFSEVSAPRQALIRRCQQIDFGKIVRFAVRAGEPVTLPETEVFLDVKLDSEDAQRPELDLKDFVLSAEVQRLFARLDQLGEGIVDHLEVRAGVPRRIVFKSQG